MEEQNKNRQEETDLRIENIDPSQGGSKKPIPYALPNCKQCKGLGRIRIGDKANDIYMCPCVIAGTRLAAAEARIKQVFPGRTGQMTLATFQTGNIAQNEKALKVARNFVEHFPDACNEGWMLGFWGVPAAGKTHLAVGIAQACMKRYGAKAEMINFPRLLFDVRERFNKNKDDLGINPLNTAMETQLLVLDDFGAHYERSTDQGQVSWVMEQLYIVLEERINMNRPTIYTTNFNPATIKKQLNNESGQRVLSRIERAEVGPPIELFPVEGANRQSSSAQKKLFS